MKQNIPKIMQVNGCLNIHERVNNFITSRNNLRVTQVAFGENLTQKQHTLKSSRPFKTSLTDWRTFYNARNKSNSLQSSVLPEYNPIMEKIFYTGYKTNKSQLNHARALSSHLARKRQASFDENLYGIPSLSQKKNTSCFSITDRIIVNKKKKRKQFQSGKLELSSFADSIRDKKQNFRIKQQKQRQFMSTQVDFFKKNHCWRNNKFNPQVTH